MRNTAALLLLLAAACGSPRPVQERDQLVLDRDCEEIVKEFSQKDPSLEEWFSDKAHGYVVFPSVGKAGLGVGGAWGRGQVYEGVELVGFASLSQGTIGLQAGIQEYAEVIFFKDEAALKSFQRGELQLSAQASAIAVDAGASTDAKYNQGVAIFTLPKGGLMVEASVGGQKFSYEQKP